MDQSVSTSRKRKLFEDSSVEKKRKKINVVPDVGDILKREEIVLKGETKITQNLVRIQRNGH